MVYFVSQNLVCLSEWSVRIWEVFHCWCVECLQIAVKSSWWLCLYSLKEGPASSPLTYLFLRECDTYPQFKCLPFSLCPLEEHACSGPSSDLLSFLSPSFFFSPHPADKVQALPTGDLASYLCLQSILFTHFSHLITQQIFIEWLLHARLRIMS